MPYSSIPYDQWGGLNLVEPIESGLLTPYVSTNWLPPQEDGRLLLRPSMKNIQNLALQPHNIFPLDTALGYPQLLVSRWDGTTHVIEAFNQALTSLSSNSTGHTSTNWSPETFFTNYGGEGGNTKVFITRPGITPLMWDSAAFSTPTWTTENFNTAGHEPTYSAITPWDHRLVFASFNTAITTGYTAYSVRFSEAGDPVNFKTNNYIDLEPGGGGYITGLCTWRDYVFVFRNTATIGTTGGGVFHVFYGTSIDSNGNPVFDYRTVRTKRAAMVGFAVAPEGVYFADSTGIYLTTGDEPVEISGPISPVFNENDATDRSRAFTASTGLRLPLDFRPTLQGTPGQFTFSDQSMYRLSYCKGYLYFTGQQDILTGSTTPRRWTFVYDTRTKQWSYFDQAFIDTKDFWEYTISTVGNSARLYDQRQENSDLPITSAPWLGGQDNIFYMRSHHGRGYIPALNRKVIRQFELYGYGQGIVTATIQPDGNEAAMTGTIFDNSSVGSSPARHLLRGGVRGRRFQLQLGVAVHGADASAKQINLRAPNLYIRAEEVTGASEAE